VGRVIRRPRDGRLVVMASVFMVAFVGIAVRLIALQAFDAEAYDELGESQRVREELLPADRGTILDRHGVELAVSINAKTVIVDPAQVADKPTAARLVSRVLGIDRKELLAKLDKPGSRFAYVARRLEPAELGELTEVLEKYDIHGFTLQDEDKRVYTAGGLAAQVIGFVRDDDGVGLEGAEYRFDDVLSGTPGVQIVERDPYGNPIPTGEFLIEPAVRGSDLVLTIDRGIQFEAERYLAETIELTKAVGGTIVALDPATGEILAMATYPGFDPNDRTSYEVELYRNRAVSDVYEPGSTLKVVTIAAALEEDIVDPDQVLRLPDRLAIHDKTYTDEGRHKKTEMSVTEIVEQSSNIGTILIQGALGNQRHHAYLQAFGLGSPASSEFPGEAAGSLRPAREWCETTCGPATAIGYRVGVTPLQMAAVFATIANDGVWVEPHIVKEIVRSDGSTETYEPVARPVLSKETAALLRQMLQGVVENGTGSRAAVDGYTVGGKTGTTEKFIPDIGYSKDDRIASFIGIAPIASPEIVIAVVLDSPKGELEDGTELKFGGVSAAPLFARIASAALHQLGVEPDAR
jgi:cell division protein FtsI (penicillin-binding protein 3)